MDSFLDHAVRASLIDMLDDRLMVVLRDGRHLIGTLRTFDQYNNVVLEGCVERRIVCELYCDVDVGLCLIRGENIVVMGDVDPAKEEANTAIKAVSEEDIHKAELELEAQANGGAAADAAAEPAADAKVPASSAGAGAAAAGAGGAAAGASAAAIARLAKPTITPKRPTKLTSSHAKSLAVDLLDFEQG